MDHGCINKYEAGIRYSQDNNIIERYLLKLKRTKQATFWHESCNVESLGCAIEGVGGKWRRDASKHPWEGWGDAMFSYALSPKNQSKLPVTSLTIPENEFIENMKYLAETFAEVEATIFEFEDTKNIDKHIEDALRRGSAVVFLYKPYITGGGHYATMLYHNDDKDIMVAHDPWDGCPHNKNNGCFEEFTREYLRKRCKPRFLEVSRI